LREQVRNLVLAPETYAVAATVAECAKEKVARLTDERRLVRSRRDLLNRYKAALPTIDLLRTARDRLATVADAPLLSADFDPKLEKAREKLNTATHEIGKLELDQQKLNEQILEQHPPADVLREEAEIDELKMQIGADVKLRAEEVKAGTFSIDELGKARDVFRELTGSTNWERMAALKPRLDQRDRINELANERLAIVQDVEREETAVREAAQLIEKARRSLEQSPKPQDAALWQELVDEISALGPLENQHKQLEGQVQEEEQRLGAEFASLQPAPAISWRDAPALPVPLIETMEHFREEFDSAKGKASKLEDQQGETKRELESLRLSLVERVGSEPVPTVDELSSARRDRDGGLHGIRLGLAGQPDPQLETDFSSRHAPGRPLIDAVEISVRHCDTLADRLRHEADRGVAFHALQQQEGALKGRLTELDAGQRSARSDFETLGKRWRDAWYPSGLVPDSPKAMQTWLANWSRFCGEVTDWRKNRRKCDENIARIDSLRSRLADGCPPARSAKTLAEGLSAARRAIADSTSLRAQMKSLEDDIRRLQKQLDEASERQGKARQRRQEWDKQWTAAVAVLELKEGTPSIETALNYVRRIDQMQQHLRDMRIKDARVREIRAERDILIGRMNKLRLGLDLTAQPTTAETLVADLQALGSALDDAREKRTRHQELSKQLQELEKKLRASNKSLAEARAALQALAEEARVSVDALPSAVQRARERAEAAKLVREYEEALAHHGQGEPMGQFETDALAGRADLDQQLADLDRKVNQLDTDVSQAERAAQEAERILDGYQLASGAAADAEQQARSLAARLEEQIKEYAALRLASAALDMAKERYRALHQDTLLDRAGVFFRKLTNEAFSGIEIDYEEGKDTLKAVRSSATRPDARVSVDGLSDGTRDQLFLALRLAGIEQHLKEREPAPLIIDDALINFDDDRAQATLRCLADFARQTQVILFTHHRQLVDLAREVDPSTLVFDLAQPDLSDPIGASDREKDREKGTFMFS
jgi:DNA repair exonuclease SbcCD ATPase subunit